MANKEHINLIKESIDAWNFWRKQNPHIQPDLEGADLQGCNLRRANLKGALLYKANLQYTDLYQANLEVIVECSEGQNERYFATSSLERKVLTNASYADFRNANLTKANLKGIVLCHADLRGANLEGAHLESYSYWVGSAEDENHQWISISSNLASANLSGINLTKAHLRVYLYSSWVYKDMAFVGVDFPSFNGAILYEANLSGIDLSRVDFSGANLSKANLSKTNLNEANLSGAYLQKATLNQADLTKANLTRADFHGANLREIVLDNSKLHQTSLQEADLTGVNLENVILEDTNLGKANLASIDFRKKILASTNLSGSSLNGANLCDLCLNGKDLRGVDLSEADLSRVQALETDFSNAILTGACIEDWHINHATKLDGVTCSYIYLKCKQQERRPHDPYKTFAVGEFTKLFQIAFETVDLIFRDGINWEAFANSFHQLQVKIGIEDVVINTIEHKGDGNFVIRVNAPLGADKVAIQRFIEREYLEALKSIEDKYRTQLQAKDEQLDNFRRENTNLWEMAKLLASRPINVEAKAVVDNQPKNVEVEMNFLASVTGATGINNGVVNINASERQKILAESAAEIQSLLKQLEVTNPSATEPEQIAYVNLATKPGLKNRAIGALKEGGEVAIEEFFLENKYLKVGKAVFKGWLQGRA